MILDIATIPPHALNGLLQAGRLVNGRLVIPDSHPIPSGLAPQPEATPAPMFTARLVNAETKAARLAQCHACDKNQNGNCTLCKTCGGRPVEHKARWEHENCPLSKW